MRTTDSEQLPPLLHSIQEACGRLRLSRSMLYLLISKGALRAIKIGRRTLIPESECVSLIQRQLEGAAD